jgi:hypothetical protein
MRLKVVRPSITTIREANLRKALWLAVVMTVMDIASLSAQAPRFSHPDQTCRPCAADLEHCPNIGCGGGDTLLNQKKNFLTIPSSYKVTTFDDFRHLQEESPGTWMEGQPRDEVEQLGEGTPVMLTGYLYGAHSGSPETCNCKLCGEENNDYHLNIIEHDGDAQTASIVVEMTPKFRKTKLDWTLATIDGLPAAPGRQRPLVRVSGYLLFDSEHVSRSGGERATIWEIHPVTKMELCPTGTCQPNTDDGWREIGGSR